MEEDETNNEWICPNCQAMWCLEEFESQECDCCGYPNNEEEEEEEEGEYEN